MTSRVRARVEGTVQGVGFRPYVYRLARELELGGWVLNDSEGVLLEVEGDPDAVTRFLTRLPSEAPPLARVEMVAPRNVAPAGDRAFAIRPSPAAGEPRAPVTADSAVCDECLRELHDPADRRYRYPFTNCTNCGPRFTIVERVPYDRPHTTMASFAMCAACRAEYADPADRRFHAQPNACPECGPRVWVQGEPFLPDPISVAAASLLDGAIVAVKGLGGFHLACLARDEGAVASLRARKHREDRPFALMAVDLEGARSLVELGKEEEQVLCGPERPIVIARARVPSVVAPSVAPGSHDLGVMLPYTPLHHLLLAEVGLPLVMTSGNVSDEPIAYEDADALERLRGIADLFLLHDRPIHIRTDDSVVRARAGGPPLLIRRSRGYVPAPVPLPVPAARPVLAVGAELKSTFCVAKGGRAWVSHHIGDLENWETLRSFRTGIAHFERLFAVEPEVVAHDLHPGYLSTQEALAVEGVDLVGVQHHHAHLAAVLAEHGVAGRAVGLIFDGTGLGTDGTVWGGEVLVGDLVGFDRAGWLWPVRLPGGAAAVREPWRMACAWLVEAGCADSAVALVERVGRERWAAVASLAAGGPLSPLTSSVGRLFDAVAALCGLRISVTFEGQAAAELEALVDREERGSYELPIGDSADECGIRHLVGARSRSRSLVLDARPVVRAVVADLARGVDVGVVAARFHRGLAAAAAEAALRAASAAGTEIVALGGGSFQNRVLVEAVSDRLGAAGLRVLVPSLLPPNDGGISYGQAAVAAARGDGR